MTDGKRLRLALAGFAVVFGLLSSGRSFAFYQDNSLFNDWLMGVDHDPDVEVELVTIAPGAEIYNRFGHSLLRVKKRGRFDMAFNFGVYDFADPVFVWDYARGFLRFRLVVVDFGSVRRMAENEERTLYTTPLDLSAEERWSLFRALQDATTPWKQAYTYNYFTNNCATRIRDLLDLATHGAIEAAWSQAPTGLTYRRLLHEGLAPFVAANFFLDLGLNVSNDEPLNAWEASFLPAEFAELVSSTPLAGGRFLAAESRVVREGQAPMPDRWTRPAFLQLAIFVVFFLAWFESQAAGTQEREWLFTSFCLASGCLSLLLLTIWLGTAHQPVQANESLLLVWPIDLLFVSRRLRRWSLEKHPGWGRCFLGAHVAVALFYLGAKVFADVAQANWILSIGMAAGWMTWLASSRAKLQAKTEIQAEKGAVTSEAA